MTRPSWNSYWASMARLVASRATCPRLHVGCILVRGNRLLATAYNGSLPGAQHCDDVGCLLVNGSCQRTVHAEQNALLDAASRGVSVNGATAYVTHQACTTCVKLLAAAGIVDIWFLEPYGQSLDVFSCFQKHLNPE